MRPQNLILYQVFIVQLQNNFEIKQKKNSLIRSLPSIKIYTLKI